MTKNNLLKFVLLFVCTLSILFVSGRFFNYAELEERGTQMKISNVFVNKKNTARFLYRFKKGDFIQVKYKKIGGNADLSDLQATFYNLGNKQKTPIELGGSISVPNDGRYALIFGLEKKKMRLNVQVTRKPMPEIPEGSTVELFEADQLYVSGASKSEDISYLTQSKKVELEVGIFPKIRVNLQVGDEIIVSCGDRNRSGILRYEIEELGQEFWAADGTNVKVPDDGEYSIRFFLNETGYSKGFLGIGKSVPDNVKNLSNPFLFEDIKVSVFRPVMTEEILFDDPEVLEESEEEVDPLADAINNMQQAMANLNNDESTAHLKEIMDGAFDLMKQMGRRDTTLIPMPSMKNELVLEVPPAQDFTKSNKICQPINLDAADSWYYLFWLGVGENAIEAYNLHDKELASSGTSITRRVISKYSRNDFNVRSYFPIKEQYPSYLYEDVDFYILDEYNKRRFEKNLSHGQIYGSKGVTTKNGFLAPLDTDLYLCLCNDNKITPVTVHFRYQNIIKDYEIR